MAFEEFKREQWYSDEPTVLLGDLKFNYQSVFFKIAGLHDFHYVKYSVDKDNLKIGFKFLKQKTDANCYNLIHAEGKSTARSNAFKLISTFPWLKKAFEMHSSKNRRFKIRMEQGLWAISFCPIFEDRLSRQNSTALPNDGSGIYRYLDDAGEIIYIGRGQLRRRFNEHDKKGWGFSTIEYSILNNDNLEMKWESWWLDKFKEENEGQLPRHNRVSGFGVLEKNHLE